MIRFILVAMFSVCSTASAADPLGDLRKPILRPALKQPAPLPESVTGKVTEYKDGRSALNIGIDAGLVVGSRMDLYRGEGKESRYLGTVVVERVYPKEAVAAFKTANGKDPNNLKADDLPQKHDLVGTYKGKKQE